MRPTEYSLLSTNYTDRPSDRRDHRPMGRPVSVAQAAAAAVVDACLIHRSVGPPTILATVRAKVRMEVGEGT